EVTLVSNEVPVRCVRAEGEDARAVKLIHAKFPLPKSLVVTGNVDDDRRAFWEHQRCLDRRDQWSNDGDFNKELIEKTKSGRFRVAAQFRRYQSDDVQKSPHASAMMKGLAAGNYASNCLSRGDL